MVQTRRSLTALANASAKALATASAIGAAALLLTGCPAPEPRPGAPPAPAAAPVSPAAPVPPAAPALPAAPAVRENHLSPATHSLVTQAKTQMAQGDLDGASSTLDRALRIEPSNPLLWIERGRLRLAQADSHQAEVCGRKALALAGGDRATQALAQRLLADALRPQQP